MENFLEWGVDWIVWLQRQGVLIAPMQAVTWLGSEEFFLFVMPALYWCVSRRLGLGMAVMLIGSNAVNNVLKLLFHLPRPFWVDPRVQALSRFNSETTYGLPSGHAQTALAIWGYLASRVRALRPPLVWVLALALIGLISVSRVVLGMHFPTDVVGGWLVGAVLLGAMWQWQAPVAAWLGRLALRQQVLLAVLVSAVFLMAGLGALSAIAGTPDPASWAETALISQAEPIAPRDSETVANAGGLLLGLGLGLALAQRYARFDAGGPWARRAARFVIGLIGMLVCWRGLALVFPSEPEAVDFAFRYVRYALTALWAIYGAPWVFLRTGLAKAETRDPVPA